MIVAYDLLIKIWA